MLGSSDWLVTAVKAAFYATLGLFAHGCASAASGGAHADVPAPNQVVSSPPGPQRASPLPVSSRLGSKNYRCNLVVGPPAATQWFDAGFEQLVSNDAWEALSTPEAFVQNLGDPGARAWSAPVRSPCSERAEAPERVVLFVVENKRATQDDWLTAVTAAVNAVRARYPTAREIQLVPAIQGPSESPCPNEPGDAALSAHAIERVTQQFDGLVQAGPKVELDRCDQFGSQRLELTPAGNTRAAQLFAQYYSGDS